MLRGVTLSGTLLRVLDPFRPCFTAPTFETFTVLVAGLVAQPVGRTVCGMLTGAGLAPGLAPPPGLRAVVQVQDRALRPGHAHQAPV